jgi:hypothetical protein
MKRFLLHAAAIGSLLLIAAIAAMFGVAAYQTYDPTWLPPTNANRNLAH